MNLVEEAQKIVHALAQVDPTFATFPLIHSVIETAREEREHMD